MSTAVYHHFGVPGTTPRDGETYLEGAKVYITDPEKDPYRIEFLRFDADSPMPKAICEQPHAAFVVSCLEDELVGKEVVLEPFDATPELRCAFVMCGNALIELMEKRA